MLDHTHESLIPISQVPSELPNRPRPHVSTVWRWVQRGCRGVKLETALVGGRRYTSREALQRFVEATTAAAGGAAATPATLSSSRRRAVHAANKDLDRAGI